MDLGLEGRSAIVMAASKGLGLASALALARESARVTICAREQKSLDEAARKIAAEAAGEDAVHAVSADLLRKSNIERVVEEAVGKFGGIDILVTNAGGPPAGAFMDIDDGQWLKALHLNVMSVVRMCRAVVPHMRKRGGGRIINITTSGVLKSQPNMVLSDSTRSMVVAMAAVLAIELAPDNILVNTVAPGPIRTQRMEELLAAFAEFKSRSLLEAEEAWLDPIPLRRMGQPSDVGDLVAYLASERAGYITGTVVPVDGGKSIA